MGIRIDKFPWPPSENSVYSSNGRFRFANKKLKNYRINVTLWRTANQDLVRQLQEYKDKKIAVYADFYFEHERVYSLKGEPKKNDVTNRIKVFQDCLCDLIGTDDKWIFKFSCRKLTVEKHREPYVSVVINTYED